ncbi:Rik1-associated factor 1 [Paramyrothecium foliicola]|nr:Rik1-associated factor 1 [Paramyrothecium foliicola]
MNMAVAKAMSRPIVDLTNDSPTTGAPQSSLSAIAFLQSREEPPPAKRRRVENGSARDHTLKTCFRDQIIPIVVKLVQELPPERYSRDDIASEVVGSLSRNPSVRIRLDETGGHLLAADLQDVTRLATRLIHASARSTQHQIIRPPPPVNRSPKPSTSNTQIFPSNETKPLHHQARRFGPQYLVDTRKYLRASRLGPHEYGPQPRPREARSTKPSRWHQIIDRPYLTLQDRERIARGAKEFLPTTPLAHLAQPTVYHVDFSREEITQIAAWLSQYLRAHVAPTRNGLACVLHLLGENIPATLASSLRGRTHHDITNFCLDLNQHSLPEVPQVLSLNQIIAKRQPTKHSNSRIHSLLLARELEGNRGFGRSRQYINFQSECIQVHEDALDLVAEFTNCAGDIATISWVSSHGFICGTTAHSDTHNQQYNKPGNLLAFSATGNTLRAFPDHRIPRPLVEAGENSTEAMRQSQDPWLYSSVVSSDYDEVFKLAYTSSFDKTVKVWKVDEALKNLATWHHEGNVNFVVSAKDGSGRVASAADIPSEAVRVYTINPRDIERSGYEALSCTRTDANGNDNWAYFPATMQWGRAPGTQHLLAIGYSPRSLSGDDNDIPEDKRQSGEIMLWDANAGCRIPVLTATTANVFEIAWHPTLPRFIVATSPCGLNVEHGVRTQIHLFQRDIPRTDGAYHEFQNLDCAAADINEITIMPNSVRHSYITAACTDGKVYVWDTAQGDKPVHVLKHGHPLDEFISDREREDTGVKFTAWGTTPDRLYTGGSDGVVKVWNVRKRSHPYLRTLLEAPGPISHGSFLEDRSQLAVGDATGRVFVFSLNKAEAPAPPIAIPGLNRQIRRPQPFIPHPDPPAPERNPSISKDVLDVEVSVGAYTRQAYLDSGKLIINPNRTVGAVQGPNYGSTALYRLDAHRDGDPTAPLLTHFDRLQQSSIHATRGRRRSVRRLKVVQQPSMQLEQAHRANRARDLDVEGLEDADLTELLKAGALLSIDDEDLGFAYEEMPL